MNKQDTRSLKVEDLENRVAPSALYLVEDEASENDSPAQSRGRDAGANQGPGGGSGGEGVDQP